MTRTSTWLNKPIHSYIVKRPELALGSISYVTTLLHYKRPEPALGSTSYVNTRLCCKRPELALGSSKLVPAGGWLDGDRGSKHPGNCADAATGRSNLQHPVAYFPSVMGTGLCCCAILGCGRHVAGAGSCVLLAGPMCKQHKLCSISFAP